MFTRIKDHFDFVFKTNGTSTTVFKFLQLLILFDATIPPTAILLSGRQVSARVFPSLCHSALLYATLQIYKQKAGRLQQQITTTWENFHNSHLFSESGAYGPVDKCAVNNAEGHQ